MDNPYYSLRSFIKKEACNTVLLRYCSPIQRDIIAYTQMRI